MDGLRGAVVQQHDVPGVPAEDRSHVIRLLLALASRRGEAASRLELAKHAGAPDCCAHDGYCGDGQDQPSMAEDDVSPGLEHGLLRG